MDGDRSETTSAHLSVTVSSETAERPRPDGRRNGFAAPQATVVAQLLAARMDLPQTRTLRRASAGDADIAYRQTEQLTPEPTLSRITSI
jgi:hypothetical protein